MVSLKTKKVGDKTYYYLSHTYREKGKVKYKEVYLGTKVPSDLVSIKSKLLLDIYKEKWFTVFERIKKGYTKEQKILPLEVKEKELERFASKFTYDTNRIEGSSLSYKNVVQLLERGISPKDKPIWDIKEAEAHKKVFFEMLKYDGDLSLAITLKWHKELFSETKKDLAGKLRIYRVYISGSMHKPPPPEEVEMRITDLFKWYSRESKKMNPVELAALLHLKFETIHPFGDGNGRIGRMIMNFVLYHNGYPMLDIKYTNRMDYYKALEKSNVKEDETAFVQWLFKRYIKENKEYLAL